MLQNERASEAGTPKAQETERLDSTLAEAGGAVKASLPDLASYDPAKYNILAPVMTLDQSVPYLQYRVVEVKLSPDHKRGDCYPAPGGAWEKTASELLPLTLALSKTGLLKLASTAGLIIDPARSGSIRPDICKRCLENAKAVGQASRCGDCPSRDDVAYQYVGAVACGAGWTIRCASYEWNKEAQRRKIVREAQKKQESIENKRKYAKPGEKLPELIDIEKYVEDRLDQVIAERFGLAETKALLRLVRDICNIRPHYSRAELANPFVLISTSMRLDPSDPASRELIAQRALASGASIFGGGAPADTTRSSAQVVHSAPDFTQPAQTVTTPVDDEELGRTFDDDVDAINHALENGALNTGYDDLGGCEDCHEPVSDAEINWCTSEQGQKKFGGHIYCKGCQPKHLPARGGAR